MTDRVEIERRCGMIMGARHGHMTLTWLPDRGGAVTAPAHGCCPPMTGTRSAASG